MRPLGYCTPDWERKRSAWVDCYRREVSEEEVVVEEGCKPGVEEGCYRLEEEDCKQGEDQDCYRLEELLRESSCSRFHRLGHRRGGGGGAVRGRHQVRYHQGTLEVEKGC